MNAVRTLLPTFIASLLLWSTAYSAPVLEFSSSDNERRYNALIQELRCLVCQNQNLADSNASLAQDLRDKTFEMIENGESDEDIVSFMVERYGDFVLYRPPVNERTLALWIGPFVILLVCLVVLVMVARRRRSVEAEIDGEKLQQARRLLDGD